MKKQTQLLNKNITYTLKRNRHSRTMKVTVYCDGSVVITSPRNFGEMSIERFIKEKTSWILDRIAYFSKNKCSSVCKYTDVDYKRSKVKAEQIIKEKIEHYNLFYGFNYNDIRVKNQKSIWGSCSRRGNLNFNFRLLFLPERMLNYVVVHELCHLGEFNHGRGFWNLVKQTIPNYAEVRKELKQNRLH
jgi:predicted metal-dependent hydrolase